MQRLVVSSTVSVEFDEDVEVLFDKEPGVRGLRPAGLNPEPENALLEQGLRDAGFTLESQLEFRRRELGPGTRGPPTARIDVAVRGDEGAVLLLETEGGVFLWRTSPVETGATRSGFREAARVLSFDLAEPGEVPGNSRPVGLDFQSAGGRIKTYVLKYLVNRVIQLAVDHIEGDHRGGLVHLTTTNADRWTPGDPPGPNLARDRPASLLLLMHGTFSSTAGTFGQLAGTASGRAFLAEAFQRYDAVIGFDHKTLGESIETNAEAFDQALGALAPPPGSRVDAVAFSRGGLVYRHWAEALCTPHLKLGKAIFVGCTNGGTNLAEPENWADMVDIYTNVAMAAARALSLLAGGGALNVTLASTIKTLGRFVQLLSEVAVTDRRAPGLASMEPDGESVRRLNAATSSPDRLAAYYVVDSDFAPSLEPRNGIGRELAEFLLDRVTNRLFQAENDLVVHTRSMSDFGTRRPQLDLGATYSFGSTQDVYHTVYFKDEGLPRLLSGWLGGR